MKCKVLKNCVTMSAIFKKQIKYLGNNTHLIARCSTKSQSSVNFANLQTMQEIKVKLHKMMGMTEKYHHEDRSWLAEYLPKTREELPPRCMNDSFDRAKVPLSNDLVLQNKYTTTYKGLRLGRLLEDMDLFAVWIVMKHIYNPKLPKDVPIPYVVVTLLVDDLLITPERFPDKDLIFSGLVSHVGKTSMEVTLWLEQLHDNKLKRITKANFVFVARDSTNQSSVLVNALEPKGEFEKRIMNTLSQRNEERKRACQDSILNKIPTPEEHCSIYEVFLKTLNKKEPMLGDKILPPGSVWMDDTKIETNILCHPEDRNLHNTVFGGFLMRVATELAFLVASVHCKTRVVSRAINSITFRSSVPIGSRLKLVGKICYTNKNVMIIEVIAKVESIETKTSLTTNTFYHVFVAPNNVDPVLPQSYHDSMLYIDGQRRYLDIYDSLFVQM
ncbi:acyl-coenzyme A thioesterase 9, mitochondrial-like [Daktulosphaira vitifoliae]|uniref:acyl-coenzyme A thioesterase 9, mitochondrial-like n=1 Tax=Daktulosphaira vitifoliae TaxID=58002 RepID=UPI0021A9E54B|nr:acyl-coenzyme A thioesterase 9, mitochondrial-like [Daktulosphaira vitifoliae]